MQVSQSAATDKSGISELMFLRFVDCNIESIIAVKTDNQYTAQP